MRTWVDGQLVTFSWSRHINLFKDLGVDPKVMLQEAWAFKMHVQIENLQAINPMLQNIVNDDHSTFNNSRAEPSNCHMNNTNMLQNIVNEDHSTFNNII